MKGVKIVFNICIFATLAVMAIIMCGYTLPPEAPDVNIVGSNLKRYECGTIPDGDSFTVTATPDGGSNYTLSYKWEYSETMNDRDWHDVAGATDTTCPIDKSLKVGSHYFRCTVTATRTADGETATAEALGIVDISRGPAPYTLPNVNLEYGDTLGDKPLEGGWSWVDETQEAGTPGAKTFKATFTPDDEVNYYPVTVDLNVTVAKRDVTITAKDQTVKVGHEISMSIDMVECENLAGEDFLCNVYYGRSPIDTPIENGKVFPRAAVIENRNYKDVTSYYNITYKDGVLTVIPAYVNTSVETADGVPNTYAYNLDRELALSLLTDEELAAYNSGTDIKVYLTVKKLLGIPGREYKPLQDYLKSTKSGTTMMLDISLGKQIGDGEPIKIENTGDNALSIGIVIPTGLLGHGLDTGMHRVFSVFRFHDGNMELLSESDDQTQIFESNLFSDYVITYRDEGKNFRVFGEDAGALPPTVDAENETAASDETTTETEVKANNSKKSPKTGASFEAAAFAVSAGAALIAAFTYKRKNEE